jgi:hypothetical protein
VLAPGSDHGRMEWHHDHHSAGGPHHDWSAGPAADAAAPVWPEPAAPAWPDAAPASSNADPAWPETAPVWSDQAPAEPHPASGAEPHSAGGAEPHPAHDAGHRGEPGLGHHAHSTGYQASPGVGDHWQPDAGERWTSTATDFEPDVYRPAGWGADGPGTPVVPAEWVSGPERPWPGAATGRRRGLFALVLGLLATVLFVVQFGVLSIAAIVVGAKHLRTVKRGRAPAVAGIVLGALSLLPSLLMAVGILAQL